MKKLSIGIAVAALLGLALMLSPAGKTTAAGAPAPQKQATDKASFWDIFRSTFSRPEPAYKTPKRGVSEVAGVRGVDTEGKLKESYDWESVTWMEQYKLNEESVMQVLEARKLGPYQAGGK